jgi:hypothetical protein
MTPGGEGGRAATVAKYPPIAHSSTFVQAPATSVRAALRCVFLERSRYAGL